MLGLGFDVQMVRGLDESVVLVEYSLNIPSSFAHVSEKSPAEPNVIVALDEYLVVHELPDVFVLEREDALDEDDVLRLDELPLAFWFSLVENEVVSGDVDRLSEDQFLDALGSRNIGSRIEYLPIRAARSRSSQAHRS